MSITAHDRSLTDYEILYCQIPGKIITNGGYLVLFDHKCLGIVPDACSRVKIKRKFSLKPKIQITTNFDDEGVFYANDAFKYNGIFVGSMNYVAKIIKCFYEIMGGKLDRNIEIELELNDCFYSEKQNTTERSVKTGLGSSCVFLIAITYALTVKETALQDLYKICLQINSRLSPKASGCDISCCIFGSSIYKKYSVVQTLEIKDVHLLLGSFNKSTNTRSMLDLLQDPKSFDALANINNELIDEITSNGFVNKEKLKTLYRSYLCSLRLISDCIVPEKQYNILLETYKYEIIGCGVSGSGGEDCVWCLVPKEYFVGVYEFWRTKFIYTNFFTNLNGKTRFGKAQFCH